MALRPGNLLGGPFDGGRLAPATRATFVWVAAEGQGWRAYQKPGAKRELYRSLGVDSVTAKEDFLYAGHSHRCCAACGGYNEVGEREANPRCQLCDAALLPA